MTSPGSQDFFLWVLFQKLIRCGFALGIEEYQALRSALRAGFGWSSYTDLRELCAALWAKSRAEQALVRSLFDQLPLQDWSIPKSDKAVVEPPASAEKETERNAERYETGLDQEESREIPTEPPQVISSYGHLPPLPPDAVPKLPYTHMFLPQYPVSYRTVAQTWRRLRWPVREGAPVELDVEATVEQRSRHGVVSPPVLRPQRRNRARLLLLVDRYGSMTPFHNYVDEVCLAIRQSGRLENVGVFYFHNAPLEGADETVLESLGGRLFRVLDPILDLITPLNTGSLFQDPSLLMPCPAMEVLEKYARHAGVVIISEAGAGRRHYNVQRLLDTVAFLLAMKQYTTRVVWLNPLPATYWINNTAGYLARYVPMFSMDGEGMYRAVNVLRGQPYTVDRPL